MKNESKCLNEQFCCGGIGSDDKVQGGCFHLTTIHDSSIFGFRELVIRGSSVSKRYQMHSKRIQNASFTCFQEKSEAKAQCRRLSKAS